MQPTEITPGSDGMVPPAAAWRYLQPARSIASLPGEWECTARFLSLVTLTFDLDIQTRPIEGPNTSSLRIANLAQSRGSAVPEIFDHKQTKKQSHRQR